MKKNKAALVLLLIGIFVTCTFINVSTKKIQNKNIIAYAHAMEDQSQTEGIATALLGLNVRSEANLKSKIIGVLKHDSKVEIVEKKEDFYKIRYKDSFAYVSTKYIKMEETKVASATVIKKEEENTKQGIVTSSSGLNVRSEANLKSKIIGFLANNEKIQVVEKKEDFYKIKYKDGAAYISGKYIKIEEEKAVSATVTENENKVKEGITTAVFGLNVRNEGNDKSKKIGILPYNSRVSIIEQVGDWYKIRYEKENAYISTKYVKTSSKN